MSLMNLTKEQKQYLVLGAIVAVVFVGVVVFGVRFSLSSIAEARIELQDLTDKIKRADSSLSKSEGGEGVFLETIEELKTHLAQIPPDRNYYSWATEIIYATAREASLEIDTINETGMVKLERDSKEENAVVLESYSLRITARGGYESLKRFLRQINQEYPLVRITGIEVSSGSKPEAHDVQIFIQWPFNLGYIAEAWESASPLPEPVESDADPKIGQDGSPRNTPTPPPPRIRPEPKAEEQPLNPPQEFEEPVSPPVQNEPAELSPVQTPPVALTEPIKSEITAEIPKQVELVPQKIEQLEPTLSIENSVEESPAVVLELPGESKASFVEEKPDEQLPIPDQKIEKSVSPPVQEKPAESAPTQLSPVTLAEPIPSEHVADIPQLIGPAPQEVAVPGLIDPIETPVVAPPLVAPEPPEETVTPLSGEEPETPSKGANRLEALLRS